MFCEVPHGVAVLADAIEIRLQVHVAYYVYLIEYERIVGGCDVVVEVLGCNFVRCRFVVG